jgi:hypothetical protein
MSTTPLIIKKMQKKIMNHVLYDTNVVKQIIHIYVELIKSQPLIDEIDEYEEYSTPIWLWYDKKYHAIYWGNRLNYDLDCVYRFDQYVLQNGEYEDSGTILIKCHSYSDRIYDLDIYYSNEGCYCANCIGIEH